MMSPLGVRCKPLKGGWPTTSEYDDEGTDENSDRAVLCLPKLARHEAAGQADPLKEPVLPRCDEAAYAVRILIPSARAGSGCGAAPCRTAAATVLSTFRAPRCDHAAGIWSAANG